MPTETLVLRADADAAIATGHVMRSLALAQAWNEAGGTATLLSDCAAPALPERAEAAGVPMRRLDRRHPDPGDLKATLALAEELAEGGDAWVALDGYHFDPAYIEAVREAGYRVLVVDDHRNRARYEADVLFNQNPGAESFVYETAPDTLCLLGFSYALLRDEFSQRPRAPRATPEVARRLLLTFGGSDPGDTTGLALRALDLVDVDGLEAVIVAGAAYPRYDELVAAAARSRAKVSVVRNVPDMPERMEWAEAAIATAGSTIMELAYMGLPSVLITLADNQCPGAVEMEKRGLASFAGEAKDVTPESLAALVTRLCKDAAFRRRASDLGRALVDGRGAARVAAAMSAFDALSLDDAVEVRKAEASDVHAVWRLANEPGVRAHSFSKEPIPLETHLAWFSAQLAREDTRYWVATLDGILAAQVRYAREDEETAEVHFSVPAAFRGKGLGTRVLRDTAERALRELGVRRIVGRVISPNEASAKSFEKAGFTRGHDGELRGQPCMVFEFQPAAVES
ncbi:MAG: UDP-2,4-diacetamido-2,4,6-trideoxy-beta-L-altropyranose hydrolase [Elusimicrobia bacterium]|nr:UDP-2,4-diacetamido-2,4,6-trideoxy-beta-L-altropyranose hydrolase [Elusimicrobiota bacterium]